MNIDNETLIKAKQEFKKLKRSDDGRLVIKLLSIIAARDADIKDVARIVKVSVSSIELWKKKFEQEGIEGLKSRPKNGHSGRLNTKEIKNSIIKEWISKENNELDGLVREWILETIKKEIKKEFGIAVNKKLLYKRISSESGDFF